MDQIIVSLFHISLYPFTSGSMFVVIPCMFAFVIGLLMLLGRMMKGKF